MYIEKVEDLKKGDEILVPAGGNLIHAILLRDPVKRPDGKWYKLTKCSVCAKIDERKSTYWDWSKKVHVDYISKSTKYEKDIINGSRIDKYMDLQDYKMIWLLNRE